jgi:site-specific DNA recombinase
MKCAIYTRVSTKRQVEEGISLDVQENRLRAYAESRGWTVYRVYSDEGRSGSSMEARPQFMTMMEDASERKFDVITAYDISRLARNTKELLNAIDELKKYNINIAVLNPQIDTTNAYGEMVFTIFGAIADLMRKETIDKIRDALEEKKLRGEPIGRPPFGFKYENGSLTRDDENFRRAQKIIEMRRSGYGFHGIAEKIGMPVSTVFNVVARRDIYED